MISISELITKIDPDKDYTIKEVKELFGVSATAISSAIGRGKMKATKLFSKYYINGRTIRDYILDDKVGKKKEKKRNSVDI